VFVVQTPYSSLHDETVRYLGHTHVNGHRFVYRRIENTPEFFQELQEYFNVEPVIRSKKLKQIK
jgi:hypothetical protein